MALTNAYVQVYGQLPEVFKRISDGQAPEKFTTQYLKDLGFGSSNYRALIPLLKALGFLTENGSPTQRYHDYRNTATAKKVMADGLRDAYGDIFTIKSKPSTGDRELIEGKFKSVHNAGPNPAKLMASTFYALLSLADLSASTSDKREDIISEIVKSSEKSPPETTQSTHHRPTLHYNIQIHLPATKDIEVFNAIFKALKEHILE